MSLSANMILGTGVPPATLARDQIPSSFNWATVTDDTPLTIRLDGQAEDLGIVPDSLLDPALLAVNDRVWVQQWGKRVLILGKASGGTGSAAGAELLVSSKSSPSTFGSIADVVWSAADVNEAGWTRDGTNVYWVCQQAGTYGIKFLYATTGLSSGATRGILEVAWNGGGTTEARIIVPYNTITQTASTAIPSVAMDVSDTIRARVQSTMTVTLSEVNLYVVRQG